MPKDTLRPHSTNDLHIAPHMLRKARAFECLVSCAKRDSLRSVSSVNLKCCFVWVWPQTSEANIRKSSLTFQNRPSARSSRSTFFFFLSPRFRMSCVLCRDSLREVCPQSSVNLNKCCFVWVWPQRQTFVRILLHSRIGRLLGAVVRRHTVYIHTRERYAVPKCKCNVLEMRGESVLRTY